MVAHDKVGDPAEVHCEVYLMKRRLSGFQWTIDTNHMMEKRQLMVMVKEFVLQ